jgi:tetratricopeptide (TPR) repeat protein
MADRRIDHTASYDVLSAYRAELRRRPGSASLARGDASWVTLGVLFEHAAGLAPRRHVLLASAREELRRALSAEVWHRGSSIDDSPLADDELLAPRVRALCEEVEDAGAVILADAILQAYLRSGDDASALERARCDALRGRLAWKRGDQDLAAEFYWQVEQQGITLAAPELEARAAIGQAILARLRGNYPASREAGARAVRVAQRSGYPRLCALGHQTLMIACAAAGDLDSAVQHAWAAYTDVRGDATGEAAGLVDLAQLFYDHGHYDLAEAGFSTALRVPLPDRIRLPALGGAALTAAQRGDVPTVRQLVEEVYGDGTPGALPYATAGAWLDAAEACARIGDHARARRMRAAAAALAMAYAYHELAHRADELARAIPNAPPAQPAPLSPESITISCAVRALAGTSC